MANNQVELRRSASGHEEDGKQDAAHIEAAELLSPEDAHFLNNFPADKKKKLMWKVGCAVLLVYIRPKDVAECVKYSLIFALHPCLLYCISWPILTGPILVSVPTFNLADRTVADKDS